MRLAAPFVATGARSGTIAPSCSYGSHRHRCGAGGFGIATNEAHVVHMQCEYVEPTPEQLAAAAAETAAAEETDKAAASSGGISAEMLRRQA